MRVGLMHCRCSLGFDEEKNNIKKQKIYPLIIFNYKNNDQMTTTVYWMCYKVLDFSDFRY